MEQEKHIKWNLFIGRFQCPHKGHEYIFNTYLEKKQPVLIAIRDVPKDKDNPLSAIDVDYFWTKLYEKEIAEGLVKVIIIPDIVSVNYGRGVGYEVKQITDIPENITAISASEVRRLIRNEDESWRDFINPKIQDDLKFFINK